MIGRAYRVLLRLLPGGFRARYSAEMQQTFEDEWRESRGTARIGLTLRSFFGLGMAAITVRVFPEHAETRLLASGTRMSHLTGVGVDARAAVRGLVRRPGFATTAIVTVGLGLGAAIAVFAVVDAAVLRGLSIPDAARVMWISADFERNPGQEFGLSAAEFTDVAAEMRSFEAVGGWIGGSAVLEPLDDRPARTMNVAFTNGAIYRIAGARTVLGRLPGADEDRLGAEPVGMISHRLWTTQFGGDSSVVRTGVLRVGRADVRIVGVLAADVALPGPQYEAWIHRVLDPASWATDRSGHNMSAIGLLRRGVTADAATNELTALERVWGERYAGLHSFGINGHGGAIQPVSARWLGNARRIGILLSVAAGALLLLACANVANLLLARGEARAAEAGVRTALGASALRVAQPVVLEGIMIAIAGTVLGLALAAVALPAFMRLAPLDIVRGAPPSVDLRVVTFAILAAVVTGVSFSWLPAWSASRRNVATLLRSGGRGRSAGLRGLRVLVAAQTALATLLLIGAGLFVQSLRQLNAVESGFARSGRIAFDVVLPVTKYADTLAVRAFYAAARERVEALEGVQRMTMVQNLPLRNPQRAENVLREGEMDGRDAVSLSVQVAGAEVLTAMGIQILEGRDLDATDRADGIRVALVNRSAARALFPGESAIGKRIQATFIRSALGLVTIVGVYDDVRTVGLAHEPLREMILPFSQAQSWAPGMRNLTIVAQTSREPGAVLPSTLAAIRAIDPFVPVQSPTTMEDVVRANAGRERFLAALLVVFGSLALTVAAIGVFGVVSFTVARQTRELAIRSALGGGNVQIFREVVRTNGGVAAIGALLGAGVASVIAPSVSTFLYQVAPRDPMMLVLVPLGLTLVAVMACVAPATKVMRVPLMQALGRAD